MPIPVITLDGPSGTGKGTVGLKLAQHLGWHFLDSGTLYRALAWKAIEQNLSVEDESVITPLIHLIYPNFCLSINNSNLHIMWKNQDITDMIRSESCGLNASKLAVHPAVRVALIPVQRAFKQRPGLIADGRDMGSVIFPNALYKFFLTASPETRALRRHLQLKQKGKHVSLAKLKVAILQRDGRDQTRSVAALKAEVGMIKIDTTSLSIDQAFSVILDNIRLPI